MTTSSVASAAAAATTTHGAATPLKRRIRSERGAELIEFAIAFPLLLLVMVGMGDFGTMFQRYIVVSNASREAARLWSLPDYTEDDVIARAEDFLSASRLMLPPTVVPSLSYETVGGTCVAMAVVTVTYPHDYLLINRLVTLANRDGISVTQRMRSESRQCP